MKLVSRPPSDSAPPRIAALSVLPAFFDLTGKRAVVAGGSEAAAWKAELLAAAGAQVDVYTASERLSESMVVLHEREPRVKLHRHVWDADCLAGAVMALADVEDESEAIAFAAAARKTGAAWNVIDRPAHCQFQFGSIVNRSPLVVGISTSGAAPVLSQAVRRRIETLLPCSLADWAALARQLRDVVAERLLPGEARRHFWERFVDRAFAGAPSGDALEQLRSDIREVAEQKRQGYVTFVGAGPGDPELLTLKAVRALQAADVILFDDLVSDEVLELARREAKRILVGKRAGRPSCKQHEINEMMIALAKAGRRVVRLKSGDPMIFGRLGEEIAALENEGIGHDVVPGITAGLAMAARLGVSLTHRDCVRSVRFVTGHSQHGGLPQDVDWAAVADPSATTIFYMGARTAARISAELIQRGMSARTPAVVGVNIGRPGEAIHSTDLAGLPDCCTIIRDGQPALIGIGRVFAQRLEAEGVRPSARNRVVSSSGMLRN
ncbi:siroheme synthase [Afipia carboxidovorans OM5]|uniref:Multifunctional siroheme synthase CysG n=1 Tax=Afipia carboxidovorans (strain ATCC 49405 / DSM 1227 / KCTC 32145 / OM5) TaxID=504832 RepID=B6JE50_AFIC5|nr:siroheme synthase CysG [Afipia carboxidovorans]ACI93943.1 siroheme synthase [Afipia carboxidovorans OM5]AEI02383.1 multifunctional siroheme synthase CysG [Afipia carboxidovorans OM4]AEI05959.1 multifunctional siroheme synthase CysG [Afipia carboxidovorans OM5]